MTTYTFEGFKLVQDPSNGSFTSLAPVSFGLSVPDGVSGFDYTTVAPAVNWFPTVEITISYNEAVLDGVSIDLSDPDLEAQVGVIDWTGGNETYVLTLSESGSDTIYTIRIGGDELPAFASVADVNDFFANQVTGVGEASAGSGFAEGDFITFGSVPNVTTSEVDVVDGTNGDDQITTGAGDDVVNGLAGNDDIDAGGGNDTVNGGDGNDYIIGGPGDDAIDGGNGNDVAAYTDAAAGITADLSTGTVSDGDGGTDTLTNIERVRGSSHTDTITGDANDNHIWGLAGDDTLTGGDGRDTLRYDRDDRYGGTSGVTVDLSTGTATDGFGDSDTISGFEEIVGTDHDDTLTGDAGDNYIEGRDGDDVLDGKDGDDNLRGGGGADTLYGGDGRDNVDAGDGDDTIDSSGGSAASQREGDIILPGLGSDTIIGHAASYTDHNAGGLDIIYENLSGIGGVTLTVGANGSGTATGTGVNDTFTYADHFEGSQDGDTMTGSAADESWVGEGGNDTIDGGAGWDHVQYNLENGGGNVTVNLATGTATDTFGDFDTLSNIQGVSGNGGDDSLTGDDDDNFLDGRSGNDTLTGAGGNDKLLGGDGADTLDGGAENDSLIGDGGNDTLIGGDGDDYLSPGAGTDTIDGGAGWDTLAYYNDWLAPANGVSVTFTAAGTGTATDWNGDTDTFTGIERVRGTAYADTLTGASGDDNLSGEEGADTLSGGGGNDSLEGGDGDDTSTGGAGNDWMNGGAGVDTLDGGDGNDTLEGGDGADSLTGGNGEDWLVGGTGDDTIDGGDGFDRVSYQNSTGGVTVNLATGTADDGMGGTDTLIGIERANGSAFNDTLIGDAGRNSFTGEQGDDVIDGAGGTDFVWYGRATGAVTVDLAAGTATGGEGNDTLSNIENVGGSNYGDTLLGDAGDNWFIPDQEGDQYTPNYLVGGADTIDGRGGVDGVSYWNAVAGVTVNLATGQATDGLGNTDTLANIEDIEGSDYDDTLIGDAGDNEFWDRGGDDNIEGGDGNDRFHLGMNGSDTVDGGAGSDTLVQDLTAFSAPPNFVYQLDLTTGYSGQKGNATLSDTISNVENLQMSGAIDAEVMGDGNNNALTTGAGDDSLDGGAGNDTLRGGDGSDQLDGGSGNDQLYGGGGGDELVGGAGDDLLDGGADQDLADYRNSTGAVTVNLETGTADDGMGGTDTLVDIELVFTTDFDDTITGDAADNQILGFGGDDIINGGDGQDDLRGQEGDDTINGGAGDDLINGGQGTNVIDGGSGYDKIFYDGPRSDYTINTVGGVTTVDGQDNAPLPSAHTDTLTNVEELVFSDGTTVLLNAPNVIDGTSAGEPLTGTDGDDVINGLGGDDDIEGRLGDDILNGGTGNDTLNGQSGDDTLNGGADNDTLFGSSGADTLNGDDGDDVLNGGTGADALHGGAGTDQASYKFSPAGVQVDLGAGTAGGGNATGDTLAGIEDLKGSDFDDVLTGDAGANRFYALAGDDVLSGADGNDWLVGNEGDDTLTGGDGDDRLDGGAGADVIDGGAGTDQATWRGSASGVTVNLATGTGTGGDASGDTISGVENVVGSTFTDVITGDGQDNRIYSLGGDDEIHGGGGVDRIKSGAGDDSLFGDDGDDWFDGGAGADAFDGGAGADMVTYEGSEAGVTVNLGTGTTIGGDAPGDTFVSIENLGGSHHDDSLAGDDGDNRLYGFAGDDVLVGGGGVDRIRGGNGNDILEGSDGNDWLSGGEGADQINGEAGIDMAVYERSAAGVQVDLGAGTAAGGDAQGDTLTAIENLAGSSHDDTLTGDGGANRLIGGAGNDTLSGAGGDDKLLGGAGDDALSGGDGNDYMVGGAGADSFDGGAGEDQVSYATEQVAVSVDLGAGSAAGAAAGDTFTGVEDLYGTSYADTLTGDASDNRLYGANGDDTLTGAGGIDRIYGGAGNDSINGGTGNDWFVGGSGADTFVFDMNWGQDIVSDFADGIDLIDLTATGLTYDDVSITQAGLDVEISDGSGNLIVLDDMLVTNIDQFDFV